MKRKSHLFLSFVSLMLLSSCSFNTNLKSNDNLLAVDSTSLTMKEAIAYYELQNEHYPFSDSFIEKYQQSSGGYLDTAKKYGIPVDKYQHSPNQKWHLLTSWFYASLEAETISWNDSAQKRIYNNLLCPELLLWCFEAGGVSPDIASQAMHIAEEGKAKGTATSTIAKNMKEVVYWPDIENNIKSYVVPESKHLVKYKADTAGITVNGLNNEGYYKDAVINFTISGIPEGKEIDKVYADDAVITGDMSNGYTLTMPDHLAYIQIKTKEKTGPSIINVPDSLSLAINDNKTLTPSLSEGSGTFSYTSGDNTIASVTTGGVITGLKEGNTTITVTCNEDTSISKVINVRVKSGEEKDVDVKYSMTYDMSEKKTATLIETAKDLKPVFTKVSGEDNLLDNATPESCIFGGGNGGRSETAWKLGNVLKVGTTSVDGSMLLDLSSKVNKLIITGYISSTNCKVRLGDSDSTDWTGGVLDNKTSEYTIKADQMTVIDKEQAEAGNASTIELTFKATDSLRIKTTSTTSTKKVLYITAIELIYDSDLDK